MYSEVCARRLSDSRLFNPLSPFAGLTDPATGDEGEQDADEDSHLTWCALAMPALDSFAPHSV
jgi:hypothetical protein